MNHYKGIALLLSLLLVAVAPAGQSQESLNKEIDALIAVFGDPDARGKNLPEAQKAIARLATIGKPAVPKLIEAIIRKQDDTAAFSGSALIQIGATAVEQVQAKWPQLDEIQKWRLMRFRSNLDYEASLEFALASLESKDREIRRQAIKYAGQYKEAQALGRLLQMLNTEMPEMHRWSIIDSLAKIGNNDEAVDALIALLVTDSWVVTGKGPPPPLGPLPPYWPDGREYVIEALGKMGARKAAPALLKVLREKEPDKGYYFNSEIADLLGAWNYTEAVPDLKRLLTIKEEWNSPVVIARSLLQLKDRSGVPHLLELLKSKHVSEREFACKAFAMHGDKSDVLLLGSCLEDEEDRVQFQACLGLERITGVVNHLPGQTIPTLGDVPLWKAWLEQNKGKYQSGGVGRPKR